MMLLIINNNCPNMLTVRGMLQQLRGWIQLHSSQIQDYLKAYPYVQYKQMELAGTLKSKVSDVISQIVNIVSSTRLASRQTKHPSRGAQVSPQALNNLYTIKTSLEQIKYAFLGVEDVKSLTMVIIQLKIDDAIKLISNRTPMRQREQKVISHRNKSQQNIKIKGDTTMEAHYEQTYRRGNQKERSERFKAGLYNQMNNYLNQKEKIVQDRRQKRIFSGRLSPAPGRKQNENIISKEDRIKHAEIKPIFLPIKALKAYEIARNYQTTKSYQTAKKYQTTKSYQIPKPYQKPKQFQSVKHYETTKQHDIAKHYQTAKKYIPKQQMVSQPGHLRGKKKFNYLQDYDRAITKIKQQIQVGQPIYNSPKIYSYKSPPSTQQHSQPTKTYQEDLQAEISEFSDRKQQQTLRKQLNFDSLLDKLKEEEVQEQKKKAQVWQGFEEDSIEKQKQCQNLQDSLQVMKAEQGLNNTGYFGLKESLIKEIHHQYSFSNE